MRRILALAVVLAFASLASADPPLVPITGGIPPTLTVTIAGVGPLSGTYLVRFNPNSDPGVNPAEQASRGYSWHGVASFSPARTVHVNYSGGGFPGTMQVSIVAGPAALVQFEGGAPQAAASWNVTLPGVVAGTANVRP